MRARYSRLGDWIDLGRYVMSRTPNVYKRLDDAGTESLCAALADGQSLRSLAKEYGTSATSILRWFDREPGRMREYQRAREAQADGLIDTLIELADEPMPRGPDGRFDAAAVNDKRLRIDTRKWIASKFRPGMYGDRVAVDANVNLAELPPDQIMAKIVDLLGSHGLHVAASDQGDPTNAS